MVGQDRDVRDFCYALINVRNKVNYILVMDTVVGWGNSSHMGPPMIMAGYDFIQKVKKDLGIAPEVVLTRLKGRSIVYLPRRRSIALIDGLPSIT